MWRITCVHCDYRQASCGELVLFSVFARSCEECKTVLYGDWLGRQLPMSILGFKLKRHSFFGTHGVLNTNLEDSFH